MRALGPASDNQPNLRFLVLGSATIVAAALVAGQTYLSMLHHGHDWWRLFLWQLLSWAFWALLTPWLMSRGEALGVLSRLRWTMTNLALCGALVAAHISFSAIVLVWIQPYIPIERMGFARAVDYLQLPWAVVDAFIFWFLLALGKVLADQRNYRELAIRESRLETELARAQLETLRLKMQPHFLFNTLNSIAALIRRRSNDQALEMVIGLSHLLRLSLDRSDDPFVTLHQEVDFVHRYVDLHLQRFADRLQYRQEVAAESLDCEIPSLILQPLVENAIRHGISRSPSGGTITLTVPPVEDGMLTVRVADDGPGLPEDFALESCQGVGLDSIRTRLHHLFGERARLTLTARPEGGTIAEIHVPVATPVQRLAVNQ